MSLVDGYNLPLIIRPLGSSAAIVPGGLHVTPSGQADRQSVLFVVFCLTTVLQPQARLVLPLVQALAIVVHRQAAWRT